MVTASRGRSSVSGGSSGPSFVVDEWLDEEHDLPMVGAEEMGWKIMKAAATARELHASSGSVVTSMTESGSGGSSGGSDKIIIPGQELIIPDAITTTSGSSSGSNGSGDNINHINLKLAEARLKVAQLELQLLEAQINGGGSSSGSSSSVRRYNTDKAPVALGPYK